MRFVSSFVLGVSIGVMSAAAVTVFAAESLGELAEREKQRRKGGSQTFSDEDLAKGRPDPTPTPGSGEVTTTPPTTTDGKPAASPTATPDPNVDLSDPERHEGIWRGRAAGTRGAVTAARQGVVDAQAKLDKIKNPYKWPPTIPDPTELAAAEAAVQDAKDKVARAEKALADFEDEARQKNIPPGWTRER
jgi:hypothetical protein